MLKWAKRIVGGAVVLIVTVLVGALGFEQWGRWAASRDFPPPGILVEAAGARSHLHCEGEGSPTVILESGLDIGGSLSWESVRPQIAELTRVCSYDRAGIMWSDGRPGPRDADHIVGELHDVLEAASESPPYVLVGHSLGGPIVRVYAQRFRDEVSGFVFVDSSHPEQVERMPPELQDLGALPSAWVLKTLSLLGVLRFTSSPSDAPLPEYARQAMAGHAPTSILGAIAEMEAIDALFSQAGETGAFGDLPLVVLSAGRSPDPLPPGMTEEIDDRLRIVWAELQGELAALSTNSDHRVMSEATHYIHWDDPDAVVSAVRDVVVAVRDGAPVRKIER